MKVFITGASGFIGSRIAERFVRNRDELILLLRDPSKSPFGTERNVRIIKGDITDRSRLLEGMKGSEVVYHLAAFTGPWSKDPSLPYMINVTGTVNVLEAALSNSVRKLVFTSTCGTLGYSANGSIIDETASGVTSYCTLYEMTKAEAEKKVIEYSAAGLDAVIVNPSRIYGPGPLTKGNSLTKIINWYIRGLWRFIPGSGNSVGNYVFIDDVVEGHILAADKGNRGERYILGGSNLSFGELFKITGEVSGMPRKMIKIPVRAMKSAAWMMETISKAFGIPPSITEEWIEKYNNDAFISSEKAVNSLGYNITPFPAGVLKTIEWLRTTF